MKYVWGAPLIPKRRKKRKKKRPPGGTVIPPSTAMLAERGAQAGVTTMRAGWEREVTPLWSKIASDAAIRRPADRNITRPQKEEEKKYFCRRKTSSPFLDSLVLKHV